MKSFVSIVVLAVLAPALAHAQSAEPSPAQVRDGAAAFIETQKFIVGRIARDCLETLGRKESPREVQDKWQKDNATQYDAAMKHVKARMQEAQDQGGAGARDEFETAYYRTAQVNGSRAVAALFKKGEKDEVCKFEMTLIDTGKMNFDAMAEEHKMPIFSAIGDLVEWAKKH